MRQFVANTRGFMTVLAVVTVAVLWVFALILVSVIDRTTTLTASKENSLDFLREARVQSHVVFTREHALNSDGLGADILMCSGGIIENHQGNPPVCTGVWSHGADGVDDACDNDSGSPYYSDTTIPLSSLISGTSDVYDDDADGRLSYFGFIYPGKTKTIFFMDDDARNRILSYSGNLAYALPSDAPNAIISITLSGSTGTGLLDVVQSEKRNGRAVAINSFSNPVALSIAGNIDVTGNISAGMPLTFDLASTGKVHFINLKNTSASIVTYDVRAKRGSDPVYISPIFKDSLGLKYLFARAKKIGEDIQLEKTEVSDEED